MKELSVKLGATLVLPENDLKKEEKKLLVKKYLPEKKHRNEHELDSLAAALFAYKKLSFKLKKIKGFIQAHQLEEKEFEFMKIALKEDLNFLLVKEILTKPSLKSNFQLSTENKMIKEVIEEKNVTKKDFLVFCNKNMALKKEKKVIEEKLCRLKKELASTKKTNIFLKKKTANFNQKVNNMLLFKEERIRLQDKIIKNNQKDIQRLNEKISNLYNFISRYAEKPSQIEVLKKLDNLGQKEFFKKNKILNIQENDFLFVNNPEVFSEKVVNKLAGKGMTIVSFKKINEVIAKNFQTIILSPEETLAENDHFILIKLSTLSTLERRIKQKDFIVKMIYDYQQERRSV